MQATGGTSLTESADAADATARRRPRVALLAASAAGVIAVDQVSKAVAVAELTGREPIELLGGVLTLNLAYNSGAAFSLAQGFTVLFSLVAVAVAVVIVRVARQLVSAWWAVALGLLLGGALGNLCDRVFRQPGPLRGHVVDFLQLPHWPIFNVADSAIVCAATLMVLLTFRGVQLDGSRARG